MPVTESDFEFIRRLVREQTGVLLDSWKVDLVSARLANMTKKEGISSVEELLSQLRSRPLGPLSQKAVEMLLTTETLFFRDFHPFEVLRQFVVPDLMTRRQTQRRLNIWSAACSSGQELYSVAMILREHFPSLLEWSVGLFGSDVSHTMLEKARRGRYTQLEINRGLPAAALVKYFTQHDFEWEIREDMRSMVQLSQLNLAAPWPPMPFMDVIFLRNVLVYFDLDTKREILRRVRRQLRPDGYLFLGSSETTINLDPDYQPTYFGSTVIYRLRDRMGEVA